MNYFENLTQEMEKAYAVAKAAREKGLDPERKIESMITIDVASRVEGSVGPKGIADIIRKMEQGGMDRTDIAFEIVPRIVNGEVGDGTKEELIDQAVRTGVGILTEGVLVAPTEGIAKIQIKENPDGSNYVGVYYAGPIRSSGGTVAALSVVLAEIARKAAGIGDYRPTESEIERYVEEVNLYEARVTHLQYKPSDEDVRTIVKNCPICIDGDPTEEVEVSVHKNLPRVETNRIRGGIPLVVCEGIALKAAKVRKFSQKIGLGWDWLDKIIKIKVKKDIVEIKPDDDYLEGLVAGRPVFCYPSRIGGFRLRYGKCRSNGIMGRSIHPATMVLVDSFLAYGTHMKVERPGKGCIITSCSNIEPPVVKLIDGTVMKVNSVEEAEKINDQVTNILYLGDMLITYGDFLKSNHPLLPPAYCVEYWNEIVKGKDAEPEEIKTPEQAFEFSKKNGVPLHPDWTYHWNEITKDELKSLAEWMGLKKWDKGKFELNISENKKILEKLLVEHEIKEGKIVLREDDTYTLINTMGLNNGEGILGLCKKEGSVLSILSQTSGIEIKVKAPTYIGARMGRPEKAKERRMDGNPNVLFPTGSPKNRSLLKRYKNEKDRETVNLDLARFKCKNCSAISIYKTCDLCGSETELETVCSKCKKVTKEKEHCGVKTQAHERRAVDVNAMILEARKRLDFIPEDVRGVKGLSNKDRVAERLEKGFLRAKYDVFVFRDGTSRFDATDAPLTHFIPKELGVSIEKLKELGYEKDHNGDELKNEDQVVPLKVQDIVLSENGVQYLMKVANFIDEMLVSLYGLPAFYNIKNKKDMIGHLCLGLSPHTYGAVLCRIIGFTKANVGYAHPYFHTAKRRNCDGDEDSIMLLMDTFINFSKHYLTERRGGTMDAPILLSSKIDPKEVDDEVFCMEIVDHYPLEFYQAAEQYKSPVSVKLKKVGDILGKEEQYGNLPFTHHSQYLDNGPLRTTYVQLGSIPEKIALEFKLEEKLNAVDVADVAKRLILNHFVPDIYGNLRSYSKQSFRCVSCNMIYRRVPLSGKCRRCGGNLTLTIHKGGIQKYLEISDQLVNKYELPSYLKQRLELVKKEIKSIFEDEKIKQTGLSDFI